METILKDLSIGDIFVNTKKMDEKWIVRGNPVFNRWHGSSTRVCQKYKDGTLHNKGCRIQVNKIGESRYKDKMVLNPVNLI